MFLLACLHTAPSYTWCSINVKPLRVSKVLCYLLNILWGFPGGSDGKESSAFCPPQCCPLSPEEVLFVLWIQLRSPLLQESLLYYFRIGVTHLLWATFDACLYSVVLTDTSASSPRLWGLWGQTGLHSSLFSPVFHRAPHLRHGCCL